MEGMTAAQRIKQQILIDNNIVVGSDESIDDAWDRESKDWALQDAINDFRTLGEPTGLHTEISRHYEADAVGRQMDDGTWVGWTYWHGGGKHGEPEAIPWIDGAYLLEVTEEEKVVTVRTFTKKP